MNNINNKNNAAATADAVSVVLDAMRQKSEKALSDYESTNKLLGTTRFAMLSAATVNEAARLEDWAAKCARAGIGVLRITYTQAFDGEGFYGEAITAVEFEFQWRYGSGEGERRWAKSVLTLNDKEGGKLSSEGACMLVYDRVKEMRKMLEGKE